MPDECQKTGFVIGDLNSLSIKSKSPNITISLGLQSLVAEYEKATIRHTYPIGIKWSALRALLLL